MACPSAALVGERARLRRMAESLKELFGPDEPPAFPTLLGHYRVESSPSRVLALLDYIDELLLERQQAQENYIYHIQSLLQEWREDCKPKTSQVGFFNLKSRELTGRVLMRQVLVQRSPFSPIYFATGHGPVFHLSHANKRHPIRRTPAASIA